MNCAAMPMRSFAFKSMNSLALFKIYAPLFPFTLQKELSKFEPENVNGTLKGLSHIHTHCTSVKTETIALNSKNDRECIFKCYPS